MHVDGSMMMHLNLSEFFFPPSFSHRISHKSYRCEDPIKDLIQYSYEEIHTNYTILLPARCLLLVLCSEAKQRDTSLIGTSMFAWHTMLYKLIWESIHSSTWENLARVVLLDRSILLPVMQPGQNDTCSDRIKGGRASGVRMGPSRQARNQMGTRFRTSTKIGWASTDSSGIGHKYYFICHVT